MPRLDLSDLLGTPEEIAMRRKGARRHPAPTTRGRSLISPEFYDMMMKVSEGALRIMREHNHAKNADSDANELIGDTKPKKKASKDKVKAKAAPAKAAKTKAKAAAPAKPAKKAAKSSDGGTKGSGKFYFPADSAEFKSLSSKVAAVKKAATAKELAEKYSTDTWKVRLVAVQLASEKKVKLGKQGSFITVGPR